MGWGISIDQDEHGHVYCDDANWETYSQDYEGDDGPYPPSSYEFIRDYMDDNYHGEIDSARDNGSIEYAHEECCSAFLCAKSAYDELSDTERTVMRTEWLTSARDELSKIVVDEDATKAAHEKIQALNAQLNDIQMELHMQQDILKPAQRKATLEKQLAKELECWE